MKVENHYELVYNFIYDRIITNHSLDIVNNKVQISFPFYNY